MARGQQDFGVYAPKTTVAGLSDLGELAARLFSPVTFDRRGDVLWLDNMEGTERTWVPFGTGTGHKAEHSPEQARSGFCSMKLTTGSTLGNYEQLEKYLPYPALSKIGFEISFTVTGHMAEFLWYIRLYNGSDYYEGRLRFTYSTTLWEIYDNGTWRTVKTGTVNESQYIFNTMKLVCDFNTNEYVRLILNETEYDLSSYSLTTSNSTVKPTLNLLVKVTNRTASNWVEYFDDCIVTQNEP